MKRFLLYISLFLIAGSLPGAGRGQDVVVSYQCFYDELSPYGQWINDPVYGYVWVPDVDDDFTPYFTNGRWVMTDNGNTWISGYPWGWACFHYGRWIYNAYYGWLWVPGYEWGPGWVAWRWGDGVCGWAPLYPGAVWVGAAYTCPADWWIFIHPRHLYRDVYHPHWRMDYSRGPRHTHVLIERTHFVTHTYQYGGGQYYAGPRAAEVQQVTRRPVQVYRYGSTSTRGSERIENNVIHTYRPARVEQQGGGGAAPAPQQVIQAPRQIVNPEERKVNRDQPRQFRVEHPREGGQPLRQPAGNAPTQNPRPAKQPARQQPVPRSTRPAGQPRPATNPRPGSGKQPTQTPNRPPTPRR